MKPAHRPAKWTLAFLAVLVLGALLSWAGLERIRPQRARRPAPVADAPAAPEPPKALPREATAFLASVKPPAMTTPREARTAFERVQFARAQQPPFGPRLVPRSALTGSDDGWERDYYAEHPEEYARFVALWGDVHGLRK